jgi:hypothetical protein
MVTRVENIEDYGKKFPSAGNRRGTRLCGAGTPFDKLRAGSARVAVAQLPLFVQSWNLDREFL